MAQHYLLSSQAKSISSLEIAQLSDEAVFSLFCEVRWENYATTGEVCCPKCQKTHQAYFIKTRRQWRCKHCNHTFSVTSGTIFASHKRPLRDYLFAILVFANAVKGLSALQLSRELKCHYKTAFVFLHKLRQALFDQQSSHRFSGLIEMDGTYVHTHPKQANCKKDRIDYRLKANQPNDKRCIIVMREHYSEQEKAQNALFRGAKHSKIFVALSENQAVVERISQAHIQPFSRIHTDESHAYNTLGLRYEHRTVNHKKQFCTPEGITNNQAESFFSRFKRMHYGQVHKMGNQYLSLYANEIAYREDNRRVDNKTMFNDILGRCLQTHNQHKAMCGYWQRKVAQTEQLVF